MLTRYTIARVNNGTDERPEWAHQLLVWDWSDVLHVSESTDRGALIEDLFENGYENATWCERGPFEDL